MEAATTSVWLREVGIQDQVQPSSMNGQAELGDVTDLAGQA